MVHWHGQDKEPISYLLSLLVVKAAEDFQQCATVQAFMSYQSGERKSGIIGAFARLVKQQPLQ